MKETTRCGVFLYATATPINFEMSIPDNRVDPRHEEKTLDQLYSEALTYKGQKSRGPKPGAKGTPGPRVVTTISTEKVQMFAPELIGFKSKVQDLPAMYEKASKEAGQQDVGSVVDAERRISEFKKFAASRLRKAESSGVTGYDECVAVLREINTKAVRGMVKLEFFMKRVSETPFEGSNPGKEGLHYRTDKVRKFYVATCPTVELLTDIVSGVVASNVTSYNATWIFTKRDGSPDRRHKKPCITMARVGYESLSGIDREISDTLRRMRAPKDLD